MINVIMHRGQGLMGNETRATMIEGAIQLLATQGVYGASLLKVLERAGCATRCRCCSLPARN